MATPTISLEEAIQERESAGRALQTSRAAIQQIHRDARQEDGTYNFSSGQEAQLAHLVPQMERYQRDFNQKATRVMDLQNSDALQRLERAPMDIPPIFPGMTIRAVDSGGDAAVAQKAPDTFGDALVNASEYKSWHRHSRAVIGADIEFRRAQQILMDARATKAPILTTGLTNIARRDEIVGVLQQRLTVADLMPKGQLDGSSYRYIRETSPRTLGAATVAQGAAKPEQPFAFTEVTADVKKIAGWAKASEETIQDQRAIASFINAQLPQQVLRREEQQLINGTGTGTEILGVLNVAGIQTYAKAAAPENNADAVFKAMMLIETNAFLSASAVVIHPDNWSAIRLMKETTQGYIWGHPSVVGPNTLWGIPVVVTANCPADTAIVGAWSDASQILYREGIRVEMTNSDQDDFIKNLVTIRAEERLLAAWYYPAGFATVTALD